MAEITRVGWGGFGFLNVPFTISYLAAGFLFFGNYRCSPGIGSSKFPETVTFVRWLGSELLLLLPSAHPEKKQPDDEENSRKMMKRIWEWAHGWTESKEDVSIEFRHFSKIFKNWERTSFPNVLQTKMRWDFLIKNVLNLIFFEALTTRQTYFDHISPITI